MKKNKKYRQGIYKPINKKKYAGGSDPVYRSSWELKFFKWADSNSRVLKWGSESIIVPYISPLDKKVHRYFVDNFIVFLNRDNKPTKYLIEIKPSGSVSRPTTTGSKKKTTLIYEQRTWVVNQAKWEAAKRWADRKGYEFLILTEKELGIR
jgi:hypothetical protein